MGGINYGKMVIGGIIAGLVYNVGQSIVHLVLFAEQSAALSESMGLGEPTTTQIVWFWVIGFVIGIAMIWLYVGIRPRFGAGVPTAIKAGVAVFVLAELIPVTFNSSAGLYAFGDVLMFVIATLVLLVISAVAGAYPYTEGDGATAPAAAPAPEPPAPEPPSDSGAGPEGTPEG